MKTHARLYRSLLAPAMAGRVPPVEVSRLEMDKSSVADGGMPGEAIRRDAASFVLPPEKISAALISLANAGKKDVTQ